MNFFPQNLSFKTLCLYSLTIAFCITGLLACTSTEEKSAKKELKKDGQQEMLQSLSCVAKKNNTPLNSYASQAKLAHFDSLLAVIKDPNDRLQNMMKRSGFAGIW